MARRRTVHRTPETGWAEFIATARAAEFFTSLGFKVMVGREFIDPIYVRGRSEAEVSESERLAKAAGVSPVLLQRMGGLTGLCATFDTGHPGKTLAVPRRARRPQDERARRSRPHSLQGGLRLRASRPHARLRP
ncbi:MAG: hypothetical protein ACLR8J_01770 [Sutterella wadsworthensis]